MNPPSEQLIRDYLNRMSVAARTKLGSGDRQALLDRTRMQIEIECGGLSTASSAQVRKALAGLGDPVAVVECEHARIAAGNEAVVGPGSGKGFRPSASLANLRRFLEAHVPAGRPAPDDGGGAPAAGAAGQPAAGSGSAAGRAAGGPDSPLVPKPAVSPEPAVHGTDSAPASQTRGRGSGPGPAEGAGPVPEPDVRGHGSGPGSAEGPGSVPEPGGSHGPNHAKPVTPADSGGGRAGGRDRLAAATSSTAGRLWQVADEAAALARHNPLEAVALVLMGAGGAAFPPVWLLGAGLALASKVWEFRDKWVGLAVPVLLVIGGIVLTLIVGGRHPSLGSYAFEAWLGAGRVSRGAGVIGAGYLLWRLHRGPREPKQPPWNVPRRLR